MLTYGIPPEFRGGVHLRNRHTPSGQSRVYRVTQLRTDGVHCRESASTGPVNLKVHVHHTEGVTECEGREGVNGVGGGIGVGGRNGDAVGGGNGDVSGNEDGAGAGAGTETTTGVEANKGVKYRNGDESGDGAGTGTGTVVETRGRTQDGNRDESGNGKESSSGDGNGDEDGTGTGTRTGPGRTGERRRSARNRTRGVDAVWETGETRLEKEKRRQTRVGSVAANLDNQENRKEAGRGSTRYPGLK